MKPTILVAALLTFLCSFSLSHPTYDDDASFLLEDRAASPIVVTKGAGGMAIYPRLEIRQMIAQQPNQWSLLVQALQAFQNVSQSDPNSFYQVAGIHGVPRQNYNGVGQCSTCNGADGYCTHDSVLFPAWHRAYVALFEQEILLYANQVVQQYPQSQQATMQAAVSTMRWPFWDWAAQPPNGGPTLPTAISSPQVTINGPSGTVTINNPFYNHNFADPSNLYYWPFMQWPSSYRYPNTDDTNAISQETNCSSALDNIRSSMQDQVYQLMTTCTDYLHFSNDQAGSSTTSCSNSLEGIHNTIHTTTGGGGDQSTSGGHMFYLATAAFDPVFFLHHCNVDRLFAMWQTIHPTSYGASQMAPHSTWTIRSASSQGPNSPLTPFFKDNAGNFWTTNQVRNWNTTFQYTYPEFADSDGSQASIINYVNNLYGPGATATAGSSKRDTVNLVARDGPLTAANGSLYQYVANIVTPRYALNGSYTVYLFSAEPSTPDDPTSYVHDPALIGPIGVLAQFDADMSDTAMNLLASGSVPLTRTLTSFVKSGDLASLQQTDVVPFLRNKLIWRIVASGGTVVDPALVPGFELSVVASTAQVSDDPTVLPVYSPFITLAEVTEGSGGGLNSSSILRGVAHQVG